MEDKNKTDFRLSQSIMTALEVEQAFKLYSYRIIPPEDFVKRISDLTAYFTEKIYENEQETES